MKLYVYTSSETALKIIKTSKLALSSPTTFNDPFDCLPLWSDDDLAKAIDIFNGYIIEQKLLEELYKASHNSTSVFQRIWFSIISAEYKFVQKLAKNHPTAYDPYFKISRLKKFLNTAIKFSKKPDDLIEANEKLDMELPALIRTEEEKFHEIFEIRDTIYVGCFSERFDSILMWSYYGAKHAGACIEFEVEEDPAHLFKVEYKTDRPQIQAERFAKEYCGRLFSEMNQDKMAKDSFLIKMIAQPYTTKSTEWQHEHEYRLIFTEKELDNMKVEKETCGDKIERYMYPMKKITKVFFGASMPAKDKSLITALAVDKGIETKTMAISNDQYIIIPS
jgi:hypothetical protein